MNPACQSLIPQLSPYVDGELSASERTTVERHLAACKECTMRAADLRAESGLLRVGMEMLADEVDFRDFSQRVLARVTPERLPVATRLRLWLTETFTYQRGPLLVSLGTAAAVLAVAVPLLTQLQATPEGYARARLEVQTVSVDAAAHAAPVVMETESGDAIIWVVEDAPAAPHTPRTGEETHEEFDLAPPVNVRDAPRGGEL